MGEFGQIEYESRLHLLLLMMLTKMKSGYCSNLMVTRTLRRGTARCVAKVDVHSRTLLDHTLTLASRLARLVMQNTGR
jgi:hypothetical protein